MDSPHPPHPGRPRDASINDALLTAAAEIVESEGFSRATVTAIVQRAGTSKPAFYRRYSHVAEMVAEIMARRHDLELPEDQGSLAADLRAFQHQQANMFNDPLVRKANPGWIAHLAEHPEQAEAFHRGFIQPRMESLGAILARAHARGELPGMGSPEAIGAAVEQLMDVFFAPFVLYSLMPGLGDIEDRQIEGSVHLALLLLGVPLPGPPPGGVPASEPDPASAPDARAAPSPGSGPDPTGRTAP